MRTGRPSGNAPADAPTPERQRPTALDFAYGQFPQRGRAEQPGRPGELAKGPQLRNNQQALRLQITGLRRAGA